MPDCVGMHEVSTSSLARRAHRGGGIVLDLKRQPRKWRQVITAIGCIAKPQVVFHKGYFRYSMPSFRIQYSDPIAILRMDGDMFESTMGARCTSLWQRMCSTSCMVKSAPATVILCAVR